MFEDVLSRVSLNFLKNFDISNTFFLGDELYVPKPSKDGKSIEWRKSYTCKEKDLFKKKMMGRMNAESTALRLPKLFLDYVPMAYLKSSLHIATKPQLSN